MDNSGIPSLTLFGYNDSYCLLSTKSLTAIRDNKASDVINDYIIGFYIEGNELDPGIRYILANLGNARFFIRKVGEEEARLVYKPKEIDFCKALFLHCPKRNILNERDSIHLR